MDCGEFGDVTQMHISSGRTHISFVMHAKAEAVPAASPRSTRLPLLYGMSSSGPSVNDRSYRPEEHSRHRHRPEQVSTRISSQEAVENHDHCHSCLASATVGVEISADTG